MERGVVPAAAMMGGGCPAEEIRNCPKGGLELAHKAVTIVSGSKVDTSASRRSMSFSGPPPNRA
jgi:hypothetical protein